MASGDAGPEFPPPIPEGENWCYTKMAGKKLAEKKIGRFFQNGSEKFGRLFGKNGWEKFGGSFFSLRAEGAEEIFFLEFLVKNLADFFKKVVKYLAGFPNTNFFHAIFV